MGRSRWGEKAAAATQRIRGYHSIATSHAGCARQIAVGLGDVGLGCAAMAAIFGLEFIPTTQVAFDLVIRRDLLGIPMITRMCEILQSGRFLNAMAGVPGYEVSGSGRLLL